VFRGKERSGAGILSNSSKKRNNKFQEATLQNLREG